MYNPKTNKQANKKNQAHKYGKQIGSSQRQKKIKLISTENRLVVLKGRGWEGARIK